MRKDIRPNRHLAYIGLGSNLEQPIVQVQRALLALDQLKHTFLLSYSSLYHSEPMGEVAQEPYINAVAKISTSLAPLELLDALQSIEQQQERVRKERWGPRTIDLDLLLFDHTIINSERLTVPHYGIAERDFVLLPLAELAPELILPSAVEHGATPAKTIQQLAETCPSYGAKRLATQHKNSKLDHEETNE